MTYLEKAIERKAQIDKAEAERQKFFEMLMKIKTARENLSPTPTLTQLRAFLKAVIETLKEMGGYKA